jgi:nitrogenase molybdenum-iron protein alpha/beta subunit
MNPADTEKALREAGERLDRAAIEMERARQELIDAAADYAMASQAHRYALGKAELPHD